jgi:hypothetical protein
MQGGRVRWEHPLVHWGCFKTKQVTVVLLFCAALAVQENPSVPLAQARVINNSSVALCCCGPPRSDWKQQAAV